jgi:hypothetical protein
MTIDADLEHFVFMKVGRHAGESFEDILERKKREFQDSGMIWWGYGGPTLHPVKRVRPFARRIVENDGGVLRIFMEEIVSNHEETEVFAKEYSVDGVNWEPVPRGVEVRGSRYALVLDELEPGDLELDFNEFRVAEGPSEGKLASEYVRGRVDKGCFVHSGRPNEDLEPNIHRVCATAKVIAPYAVLLRNQTLGDVE